MNKFLIIIDGPMGSGKTTASKLLHVKLEGTARVALADIKRLISGFEKDHEYNKISQEVILVMVDEYLKRGINVIVEWAMKKERGEAFIEIAKKYNVRCLFYRLDAPRDLLIQRVKDRTAALLDKPELEEYNLENIEKNFEKNYSFHVENSYKEARVIDSEKLSGEEIAQLIMKDLS